MQQIAHEIRERFQQKGAPYTEAEVEQIAREIFNQHEINRYDEEWYDHRHLVDLFGFDPSDD